MSRSAEVVLFRYEGEVGVRAIVDLGRRAATDVSRLSSDQVPMTQNDLADAWQLAQRDEQVRAALGGDVARYQVERTPPRPGVVSPRFVVRALRVETADEKDPCYKRRCLELLFVRGNEYLTQPTIIVDLSAQKVYVQRKQP